jgi:hypothetical protein
MEEILAEIESRKALPLSHQRSQKGCAGYPEAASRQCPFMHTSEDEGLSSNL